MMGSRTPSDKAKKNDAESSATPFPVGRSDKRGVLTPTHSTVTFKDVGGMGDIIKEIPTIFYHHKDYSLFQNHGIIPSRGILLHGPSGCGKTHFARAIAGELGLPIFEVFAVDFSCDSFTESTSTMQNIFDAAFASGRCILLIKEIEEICFPQDLASIIIKGLVGKMKRCFEELDRKDPYANVMVIGTTTMADSIDRFVHRDIFGKNLAIRIPNEEARLKILKVVCKNYELAPDMDYQWLAHNTAGYVGGDLHYLVSKAVETAIYRMVKFPESGATSDTPSLDVKRNLITDRSIEDVRAWFKTLEVPEENSEKCNITLDDFKTALRKCVPRSQRGFVSFSDTTWDDIGALEDIKKELRSTIVWLVKYHNLYAENNLSSTKGILLHGPKGCGKTLLAKAIANECSINFLSVSGPELLSMNGGESEKAVRTYLEVARYSAPCVIFFDLFDALCPSGSSAKENAPIERLMNRLLTETDIMQERKRVFLLATTNRLKNIDSAMLRPGRFEKLLYVGLPTPDGRVDILKSQTKNKTRPKIEDDLALEKIALDERCNGFSGADLAYLVREATSKAVK